MAGIDGNRDGANSGKGGLEGSLGASSDINVLGDGTTGVGGVVLAGAVTGGVGVRSLGVKTASLDDIGESVVHQTAVAALVALGGRAVDQVLLGERDELAGGLEVSTLDGAGGGERPARAALALILDGGDVALGAPVDGSGVDLVALNEGLTGAGAVEGAEVHLLVLGVGLQLLLKPS